MPVTTEARKRGAGSIEDAATREGQGQLASALGLVVPETVSPFIVMEYLDVIDDVGSRLVPRCMDVPLDPLALERLIEALGNGVVVKVAAPTAILDG
jgi:hypothetical protein